MSPKEPASASERSRPAQGVPGVWFSRADHGDAGFSVDRSRVSGRAVFEGVPGTRAYNPQGTVHGGYASTLLDSACACAVHSRLDASQGYTTLELKVAFHRTMTKDTGVVRAIGTVVSFGRRTAFAEARLVGADDKLFATASSTLMVFDCRSREADVACRSHGSGRARPSRPREVAPFCIGLWNSGTLCAVRGAR